jgi:hypothetical protein
VCFIILEKFPIRFYFFLSLFSRRHFQQAVLFHLTNLTPRLNKACSKHQKASDKAKRSNELFTTYITFKDDHQCEVIRKDLCESIEYNRKFTFNISFNSQIEKMLSRTGPKTSAWNVKNPLFVSTGSFDLNKSSSYCSDREMPQRSFFANSGLPRMNFFDAHLQQKRHFKTFRAQIAENKRNPTLLSRLKEAYNQPVTSAKRADQMNQTSSKTSPTVQHEFLTKILTQNESNLTPEQAKLMKLMFAEGYLAANHSENQEKGGKTIKYLKVSRNCSQSLSIIKNHNSRLCSTS